MEKKLVIIAHNIRSAYNVGAIFRTMEGLGASKIYLDGYSPAPFGKNDRYPNRGQKALAKTALGAEKNISWEKTESILKLVEKLRNDEYQIIGLEINPKSVAIKKFKPRFPCALILGNEADGIEKNVLGKCDKIIQIPMKGKKESLNVSVAAGIAVYEILNK
jgi:23S rRNA (guanosine2251-2'-O)-methyltransferase